MRSHGWFQTVPFAWDEGAGALERVEALPAGPVRLRVEEWGNGVAATPDRALSPAEARELRRRLARMLQLRADLAGFPDALGFDPALRADLRAYGAGRLLAGTSLYEDVVKGICGTNITWRQAVTCIAQLGTLGAHGAFPGPEALVDAGEDRLRTLARVGYRAPFLVAAARAGAEEALDALDAQAPGLCGDELHVRLRALPGVGPATASFLMLLMGRYERPGVDAAVLRAASARWFGGRRPRPAEVLRVVAPAGDFAGLALYWATMRSWQRETGLEAGATAGT